MKNARTPFLLRIRRLLYPKAAVAILLKDKRGERGLGGAGQGQGIFAGLIGDNHRVEFGGPEGGYLFRSDIDAPNGIRTRGVMGVEKNRKLVRSVRVHQVQKNTAGEPAEFGVIEMITRRGEVENSGRRHSLPSRERLQRHSIHNPGSMPVQRHFTPMVLRRGSVYVLRTRHKAIDQSRQTEPHHDSGGKADPTAQPDSGRHLLPDSPIQSSSIYALRQDFLPHPSIEVDLLLQLNGAGVTRGEMLPDLRLRGPRRVRRRDAAETSRELLHSS